MDGETAEGISLCCAIRVDIDVNFIGAYGRRVSGDSHVTGDVSVASGIS
jgi:hypothetical protein